MGVIFPLGNMAGMFELVYLQDLPRFQGICWLHILKPCYLICRTFGRKHPRIYNMQS
jgi:hypothetical protein